MNSGLHWQPWSVAQSFQRTTPARQRPPLLPQPRRLRLSFVRSWPLVGSLTVLHVVADEVIRRRGLALGASATSDLDSDCLLKEGLNRLAWLEHGFDFGSQLGLDMEPVR